MKKNYISIKDESVSLFNNRFLDIFSRVHWVVPVLIFLPTICWFVWRSFAVFELHAGTIILYFLGGLVFWTAAEYFIHRYVFHFTPKTPFMERIHFLAHGVHHDYPNDSKRLVMPPVMSIPLATLFYFLFKFILGDSSMNPAFAGFLLGYLTYDMMHYAIHHANFRAKWWQRIKQHHMVHHFHDPHKGYGVSSKLWDKIMRTDFPPQPASKKK